MVRLVAVAVLLAVGLAVAQEGGLDERKGKCKAVSLSAAQKKKLKKFTARPSGAQCWWDHSRKDCAQCKSGGKQCGFPMHKWCQAKKSKQGCPGIPQSKFTRSAIGYPCMGSAKFNTNCAWCVKGAYQCKGNSKGCSFCGASTNAACDGVQTSCSYIPLCGYGAKCAGGNCKCANKGNGMQCFDKKGDLIEAPDTQVKVNIKTATEFIVHPHQSAQFGVPTNLVEQNNVFSDIKTEL